VEILNQLGELFLAAVPTVFIVFLFYLFLRWSFFAPMQTILAARHARAEGARQQAEAARISAQQKLSIYNEALRKARIEIFAEQEAARRRVLEERQGAVQDARLEAQRELQAARKSLAADVEAARLQLGQTSAELAGEIADSLLAGRPAGRKVPIHTEAQ
jgi:F0F1-type ATP synthase membrane subunit b/b'